MEVEVAGRKGRCPMPQSWNSEKRCGRGGGRIQGRKEKKAPSRIGGKEEGGKGRKEGVRNCDCSNYVCVELRIEPRAIHSKEYIIGVTTSSLEGGGGW